MSQYVCVVFVNTEDYFFAVKDEKKDNPFWKLPGGKSKDFETKVETAQRELEEETGLFFEENRFILKVQETRFLGDFQKEHTWCLFEVKFTKEDTEEAMKNLKKIGNEGELVEIKSKDSIYTKDFFLSHVKALKKSNLI